MLVLTRLRAVRRVAQARQLLVVESAAHARRGVVARGPRDRLVARVGLPDEVAVRIRDWVAHSRRHREAGERDGDLLRPRRGTARVARDRVGPGLSLRSEKIDL